MNKPKPASRPPRSTPPAGAVYRSGAAARLAGVPVETLRVWERRYAVIGPAASERGQRLYTSEQVRRLGLIKRLVELGNPISAVAKLPDETLAEMHAAARAMVPGAVHRTPSGARPVRVALIGEGFAARGGADVVREAGLDVVVVARDLAQAPAALARARAEVLVAEVPSLLAATGSALRPALDAVELPEAVILYRFGQRELIRALRREGHVVARMPLDPAEIEPLCRAALIGRRSLLREQPSSAAGERAPRFDDASLSGLALASSTVYCECPRHLADLLRMLVSFERYSAECEHRSPDDAELHRDLKRTASQARVLIEDAMVRVALAEGLPLPPDPAVAAGAAGGS